MCASVSDARSYTKCFSSLSKIANLCHMSIEVDLFSPSVLCYKAPTKKAIVKSAKILWLAEHFCRVSFMSRATEVFFP